MCHCHVDDKHVDSIISLFFVLYTRRKVLSQDREKLFYFIMIYKKRIRVLYYLFIINYINIIFSRPN